MHEIEYSLKSQIFQPADKQGAKGKIEKDSFFCIVTKIILIIRNLTSFGTWQIILYTDSLMFESYEILYNDSKVKMFGSFENFQIQYYVIKWSKIRIF